MKKNKWLKITSVIMILAMACLFLFACANDDKKDEDKVEEPTMTADDVKNKVSDAIVNSFKFDKTKPIGFEYGLTVPVDGKEYNLHFNGYIDTETATSSRMYLDFLEGEKAVFTLSADDEYLYFVSEGEKRRFRNFDLATAVSGKSMPGYDDISGSIVGAIPSLAMSLIFDSDKFDYTEQEDGRIDATVYGSLDSIATMLSELIGGVVPAIGDVISNVLSDIEIELSATLNSDKIESAYLKFDKGDGNIAMTFKSKIDNYKPEIVTPSSKDMTFTETNIVNFAIEGKFDMVTENNYTTSSIATYNYEIYADLDLFTMIRDAIVKSEDGKLSFDAARMFSERAGNFYFNVSHICTETCGCNKLGESKGSILTFAFSPASFGTTDFMVSANIKAILPKGLLDGALGLPSDAVSAITAVLGDQLGTNIDPAVLFADMSNAEQDTPQAGQSEGTVTTADNYNILAIIGSVLDVISDIRMDDIDGLRLGADSITDLLGELDGIMNTGDIKVAEIVRMFFGEANYLNIDVDYSAFGLPELETKKYNEMFQIIDENVGGYKFTGGPVVKISPVLDANGNIVLASSDATLKLYDKQDGVYTPLPLSIMEAEALLKSDLNLAYTYETITGKTGNANLKIQKILDFDPTKVGSQQVRLVTGFADGGLFNQGASALIEILSSLVFHVDIPGRIMTTNIIVVDNPTIKLTQGEDVVGKIEEGKTYKYGDALYGKVDVNLTYKDGSTKTISNIQPANGLMAFENAGNKSTSKVNAVADFVLDFGIYGKVNIDMDESVYKAPANIVVDIKENETHTFNNTITFTANDEEIGTNMTDKNVEWTTPEGVVVATNGAPFENYVATFTKAGKFDVVATIKGTGIKQTYTFNVGEYKELPEFTAKVTKAIGNANKKYSVTVGRANQFNFGMDSVKASIKVDAVSSDEMTTKELVFGEDYDIMVDGKKIEANELVLLTFQGKAQKFDIMLKDTTFANAKSMTVTFKAVDFENRTIGGGEYLKK